MYSVLCKTLIASEDIVGHWRALGLDAEGNKRKILTLPTFEGCLGDEETKVYPYAKT